MNLFNENTLYYTLIISILMSLKTLFIMVYLPKYFHFMFGTSIANKKTSKFHQPMARGLGIVYPFVLIFSFLFLGINFELFELILITISTLVGFWDDKFGIKYKSKLCIYLILGFIYSLNITENVNYEIFYYLNFFLNIFIFVFLLLFFNQIDGINGLAASTFLVFLLFIFLNGISLFVYLPIICSIFIYLVINMRGRFGIQGDAGSLFMGSFAAVLFLKNFDYFEYVILFFVISPVLFDVCATTLIKLYYGIDLSVGHRDNLYQKLVYRYQAHYLVTGGFAFAQIMFCLIVTLFINNFSYYYIYIFLTLIGIFFTILFCYLSYSIHNKIFFK